MPQVYATPARKRKKTEPATTEETPKAAEHVAVDDLDDLLAEIDSVLETNALEVVRSYVQRPGE